MCTIRNPRIHNIANYPTYEMVPHVTLDQYNELLRKYDARGKQLAKFKVKILRLYEVIRRARAQ